MYRIRLVAEKYIVNCVEMSIFLEFKFTALVIKW